MNHATKISISLAILAVIATGVWYALKGAPEAPPADGGTDAVVDNAGDSVVDDEAQNGGVDTSDWIQINGAAVSYSILIPNGYESFDPYIETKKDLETNNGSFVSDIFYFKNGNRVIRTWKDGVILSESGEALIDVLRNFAAENPEYEMVTLGTTEFMKHINTNKKEVAYTTTDNASALMIVFQNVDESIVQNVLQSFRWK